MSWAVGVLTWNRHDECRRTVAAMQRGLVGDYEFLVYDNGSDVPFEDNGHRVVRGDTNLGAGGGVSALVRHLLDTGAEHLLFSEDDWTLEEPLNLEPLAAMCGNHGVGQVRLAVRPEQPSEGYWTYALEGEAAQASLEQRWSRFYAWSCGKYQLVRLLWTNNPWACRREVAERFCLTGEHEIAMARPYLASGLLTADTVPGHFRHRGVVKERRGETGWKR